MAGPLSPLSLRKFSDHIRIYDPQPDKEQTNPNAPTTVVLFTWADASPRLVQKYVQGYHDLYPSAKLIIVTARTMATFFGGQEAAKALVKDMVSQELYNDGNTETIHSYSSAVDGSKEEGDSLSARNTQKQPRILMHAFSNSGGLNLEAVSSTWHAMQHTSGNNPGPIPLHGLILDSTPGGASFRREFPRWVAGIAIGFAFLPKPLAKLTAAAVVVLLMGLPALLGLEGLSARGRRVVNSPDRIPTSSARLYIYSDSDPLIGHLDVEEHAREASEVQGYRKVVLEKFSGSGHVAHLRHDPQRYWGAISKFWDSCCSSS